MNDILYQRIAVGSMEDIDFNDWHNNQRNFAGYYAEIIQRVKEIQPRAKFFLMTMADEGEADINRELKAEHRRFLYELSEKFDNTYVIDLMEYAPLYDGKFREKFFMQGHMNPMGYLLTARMVASYIDYIIRHNMKDFYEIGFIGTDLHGSI